MTSSESDPGLRLVPAFRNRTPSRAGDAQPRPRCLPIAAGRYAGRVTAVTDVDGVRQMIALARQRPLYAIGIDFTFRYARPGVALNKKTVWEDPRSAVPLLLGICLVERADGEHCQVYRFAVDVRDAAVAVAAGVLFALPVPFVGHFIQDELICGWKLGWPAPDQVWDTWVAERSFNLGIYHERYFGADRGDEREDSLARERAEEALAAHCDLIATCERYGLHYPFVMQQDRLQKSFLDHPAGAPFTDEQVAYVAANAAATAELYEAQMGRAVRDNAIHHLVTVEMPWSSANAQMVWDGVRVDQVRCRDVLAAARRHTTALSSHLAKIGLKNVDSPTQVQTFMGSLGLLDLFRVGDGYSFADDRLEAVEGRHPAISTIRDLRRVKRLLKDKLLTGELVGADGRLHPRHRQLGAESSRNSMSAPNVGGIGRALRPVVISDPGYGIGEVDLCQIEVGMAAAVYGVPDLMAMFNGRDVYTAMAHRFYADTLPADSLATPDKEFKRRHPDLRSRMKVFTLATIYNITPRGLSAKLGVSEHEAAAGQAKFLAMFPGLDDALRAASEEGAIRGFAALNTGLRRYRRMSGHPDTWEVNWMRNTPVQGSAAVAFKTAGARLSRRFQYYGARLILPMHDAFVFEAPLDRLDEVATVTAEVMRSAVQEHFPTLRPEVDVNIDHPDCWNKDGKWQSLDYWLIEPSLAREYLNGDSVPPLDPTRVDRERTGGRPPNALRGNHEQR